MAKRKGVRIVDIGPDFDPDGMMRDIPEEELTEARRRPRPKPKQNIRTNKILQKKLARQGRIPTHSAEIGRFTPQSSSTTGNVRTTSARSRDARGRFTRRAAPQPQPSRVSPELTQRIFRGTGQPAPAAAAPPPSGGGSRNPNVRGPISRGARGAVSAVGQTIRHPIRTTVGLARRSLPVAALTDAAQAGADALQGDEIRFPIAESIYDFGQRLTPGLSTALANQRNPLITQQTRDLGTSALRRRAVEAEEQGDFNRARQLRRAGLVQSQPGQVGLGRVQAGSGTRRQNALTDQPVFDTEQLVERETPQDIREGDFDATAENLVPTDDPELLAGDRGASTDPNPAIDSILRRLERAGPPGQRTTTFEPDGRFPGQIRIARQGRRGFGVDPLELPRGTGFIQNNQTGNVTRLNFSGQAPRLSRASAGGAQVPQQPRVPIARGNIAGPTADIMANAMRERQARIAGSGGRASLTAGEQRFIESAQRERELDLRAGKLRAEQQENLREALERRERRLTDPDQLTRTQAMGQLISDASRGDSGARNLARGLAANLLFVEGQGFGILPEWLGSSKARNVFDSIGDIAEGTSLGETELGLSFANITVDDEKEEIRGAAPPGGRGRLLSSFAGMPPGLVQLIKQFIAEDKQAAENAENDATSNRLFRTRLNVRGGPLG